MYVWDLNRLEQIEIFTYDSGAVFYTELTHQSQEIGLFDAVSNMWSILVNRQTVSQKKKSEHCKFSRPPKTCAWLLYIFNEQSK